MTYGDREYNEAIERLRRLESLERSARDTGADPGPGDNLDKLLLQAQDAEERTAITRGWNDGVHRAPDAPGRYQDAEEWARRVATVQRPGDSLDMVLEGVEDPLQKAAMIRGWEAGKVDAQELRERYQLEPARVLGQADGAGEPSLSREVRSDDGPGRRPLQKAYDMGYGERVLDSGGNVEDLVAGEKDPVLRQAVREGWDQAARNYPGRPPRDPLEEAYALGYRERSHPEATLEELLQAESDPELRQALRDGWRDAGREPFDWPTETPERRAAHERAYFARSENPEATLKSLLATEKDPELRHALREGFKDAVRDEAAAAAPIDQPDVARPYRTAEGDRIEAAYDFAYEKSATNRDATLGRLLEGEKDPDLRQALRDGWRDGEPFDSPSETPERRAAYEHAHFARSHNPKVTLEDLLAPETDPELRQALKQGFMDAVRDEAADTRSGRDLDQLRDGRGRIADVQALDVTQSYRDDDRARIFRLPEYEETQEARLDKVRANARSAYFEGKTSHADLLANVKDPEMIRALQEGWLGAKREQLQIASERLRSFLGSGYDRETAEKLVPFFARGMHAYHEGHTDLRHLFNGTETQPQRSALVAGFNTEAEIQRQLRAELASEPNTTHRRQEMPRPETTHEPDLARHHETGAAEPSGATLRDRPAPGDPLDAGDDRSVRQSRPGGRPLEPGGDGGVAGDPVSGQGNPTPKLRSAPGPRASDPALAGNSALLEPGSSHALGGPSPSRAGTAGLGPLDGPGAARAGASHRVARLQAEAQRYFGLRAELRAARRDIVGIRGVAQSLQQHSAFVRQIGLQHTQSLIDGAVANSSAARASATAKVKKLTRLSGLAEQALVSLVKSLTPKELKAAVEASLAIKDVLTLRPLRALRRAGVGLKDVARGGKDLGL